VRSAACEVRSAGAQNLPAPVTADNAALRTLWDRDFEYRGKPRGMVPDSYTQSNVRATAFCHRAYAVSR